MSTRNNVSDATRQNVNILMMVGTNCAYYKSEWTILEVPFPEWPEQRCCCPTICQASVFIIATRSVDSLGIKRRLATSRVRGIWWTWYDSVFLWLQLVQLISPKIFNKMQYQCYIISQHAPWKLLMFLFWAALAMIVINRDCGGRRRGDLGKVNNDKTMTILKND